MPVAQDQYASEYGWVMSAPQGWEPLPLPPGPAISLNSPVVFSCTDDSDLSLTWMVAGHPSTEVVARRFLPVTQGQRLATADLIEIAPAIFPLIGTPDSCEIVELADGSRAIEVIETYLEDDEKKNGYQLILPLVDGSDCPRTFQRLCFYAPADKFSGNLAKVRSAARSFHYTRRFGWK